MILLYPLIIYFILFNCVFSQQNLFTKNNLYFDDLVIDSTKNTLQDKNNEIDFGIGIFRSGNKIDGFSGSFGINFIRKSYTLKAKLSYSKEFVIFAHPKESYYTIAMMIGQSESDIITEVNYYAGIGIISGYLRGKYISEKSSFFVSKHELETFIQLSIPLELNFRFYNFGVSFYAEINAERPIIGSLLKVYL